MLAPDFSRAWFTACLSANVRPGAGNASSAEPPPEIRHSTRSSAVSPCTLPRISAAAFSRSEEHTSELQSLMRISYAVFCLKKKNKKHTYTDPNVQDTHSIQTSYKYYE